MKKQLQRKDVESSSKNRAQFAEFIVGKLQDRAREQGRNPMAVKAPNEKTLLGLRQDLLPDKRSKVVSKTKRRLHVLGDYLTQTSLVGALGAALHGHMPETGEEARVLAALFLNTDGTGIELAGDKKQDIYGRGQRRDAPVAEAQSGCRAVSGSRRCAVPSKKNDAFYGNWGR
jgi:hypothetical protein